MQPGFAKGSNCDREHQKHERCRLGDAGIHNGARSTPDGLTEVSAPLVVLRGTDRAADRIVGEDIARTLIRPPHHVVSGIDYAVSVVIARQSGEIGLECDKVRGSDVTARERRHDTRRRELQDCIIGVIGNVQIVCIIESQTDRTGQGIGAGKRRSRAG